MKTFSRFFFAITITAFLVFSGPIGCFTGRVSETSVYQGDSFLYNVEKTTVQAYRRFDDFLNWEEAYRSILPVEVSRVADVIRVNAKKWINSSIAMRDAYVAAPSAANKDKLTVAVNLIDAALAEAAKYVSNNKSKAPYTGVALK